MSEPKNNSIKNWAEEDRPREKLESKGAAQLTKAELVAIMIRSGTREKSAVMLAQEILRAYDDNLGKLGKANIKELMRFNGIGKTKAISITAALELGRRRQMQSTDAKPKITSSQDAYQLLVAELIDLNHEIFKVVLLNRQNKVIKISTISMGGVAGTVVDPKIIFKLALDELASSIVLSHNHPSGNLKPSQADLDITKKVVASGKMLDIKILDHLIISSQGYFSFADEGLI